MTQTTYLNLLNIREQNTSRYGETEVLTLKNVIKFTRILIFNNMDKGTSAILPHHIPEEFCRTRAAYRQGKKLTAVKVPSKVYTVSKESSHLLIFNVPAINLGTELQLLCERYGKLTIFEKLPKGLELEKFTDVFHVNYLKVPCARYAKKLLDNRSFYGGFLHVCYAPERESLEETRMKLITRRTEMAIRTGRKANTKNIHPHRFFKANRKRPNGLESTSLEETEINFLNKATHKDNQCVPKPPFLIPTPVLKRRTPSKGEPPKKIPRIIFYQNNNKSE